MLLAKAAVPLQTWSGPEGSRKLRFPDFKMLLVRNNNFMMAFSKGLKLQDRQNSLLRQTIVSILIISKCKAAM
jgi:hypothetical protein